MNKSCIIVGGGIAGPATALALTRIGIKCTIYELRDGTSEIGGAIQLPPNAIRLLDDLNISVTGCIVKQIEMFSLQTSERIGSIPFAESNGYARRVLRADLKQSLLDAVNKNGIELVYNSQLVSIEEDTSMNIIRAIFSNGTTAEADFLVGCDGVHSTVRSAYVEPDCKPIYTGAAGAYSIIATDIIKSPLHFQDTGLNMSRHGTILTTFIDETRSRLYIGAVMETPSLETKDEWRAKGQEHDEIIREIHRRYDDSSIPSVPEMISQMSDLILYPIFTLPPNGKWSRGRAVLIGDAAHAVSLPPTPSPPRI